MSKVVRIPADLYERLEAHAKGFDTPANVIEKMLDHFEGVATPSKKRSERRINVHVASKDDGQSVFYDRTKYIFQDRVYGKGRLVLAVMRDYVKSHPNTFIDDLYKVFPEHLQGSVNGVFKAQAVAQERFEQTRHKRHFLKADELIQLQDALIAVSNQWGRGNIGNFIQTARDLGYEITPIDNNDQ